MTTGPQENKSAQPVEPKEQPPNSDWIQTEEVRKEKNREDRETK